MRGGERRGMEEATTHEIYCPACQEAMRHVDLPGVQVEECRYCDGLWFDRGEPEALTRLDVLPKHLLEPVACDDSRQVLREGLRLCPRCHAVLAVTTCRQVSVDVCVQCRGLFLDRWEFQRIIRG